MMDLVCLNGFVKFLICERSIVICLIMMVVGGSERMLRFGILSEWEIYFLDLVCGKG